MFNGIPCHWTSQQAKFNLSVKEMRREYLSPVLTVPGPDFHVPNARLGEISVLSPGTKTREKRVRRQLSQPHTSAPEGKTRTCKEQQKNKYTASLKGSASSVRPSKRKGKACLKAQCLAWDAVPSFCPRSSHSTCKGLKAST